MAVGDVVVLPAASVVSVLSAGSDVVLVAAAVVDVDVAVARVVLVAPSLEGPRRGRRPAP